jgi:hypothetical protein
VPANLRFPGILEKISDTYILTLFRPGGKGEDMNEKREKE